MSDDAFALTPAAAQPPQPSEAVYQALNAALSATARGRWFLSEFAKRNRNSESSKMLDAVARIEQAVADRPALTAASADLLIARGWAQTARLDALSLANATDAAATRAAAQRAMRIIREISISLRAAGQDARICNILDAQLDAIETAQQASEVPSKGMLAAFDRLLGQLDELIPPPPTVERTSEPPPLQLVAADPEARLAAVADLAAACATGDPDDVTPTAAQIAEDDDLLARIALEMASPDEEAGAPLTPAATPIVQTEPQPEPPPPVPDNISLSLGQSLLAQGLVTPPLPKPSSDPFAALKTLTQSERVALFT